MPLGKFLSVRMGLTKHQISQAKFRERGICVDKEQRRINYLLQPGEIVEVRIEAGETASPHLTATKGELDILWEDQDLLVVNKPAGLVTHPSHGHFSDTLANYVAAYAKEKEERFGECFSVRAIGRLDKDTSGLVVFAKNQVAAARLAGQRETGDFFKTYLALASGRVTEPAGEISFSIRKVPGHLMKMEGCREGGLCAKTRYRVLRYGIFPEKEKWLSDQDLPEGGEAVEYGNEYTVTEVTLGTGRTHQIRVHFSEMGHPLLGDPLYGSFTLPGLDRTALHAWKMEFRHPFLKNKICLEAPAPADMQRLL